MKDILCAEINLRIPDTLKFNWDKLFFKESNVGGEIRYFYLGGRRFTYSFNQHALRDLHG